MVVSEDKNGVHTAGGKQRSTSEAEGGPGTLLDEAAGVKDKAANGWRGYHEARGYARPKQGHDHALVASVRASQHSADGSPRWMRRPRCRPLRPRAQGWWMTTRWPAWRISAGPLRATFVSTARTDEVSGINDVFVTPMITVHLRGHRRRTRHRRMITLVQQAVRDACSPSDFRVGNVYQLTYRQVDEHKEVKLEFW